MNVHPLLADFSIDTQLADLQPLLPVAAGLLAGLGMVGVLHFLNRPRAVLGPQAKEADEPEVADPFVHGSASEQRKAFRRHGSPVEVLIVDQTLHGAQSKGYVVDRCVGGLGLLVERPIEAEHLLTVRPRNAPPLAPWVEVVVKSCRESNPGYELGCQFVKTPPWALLLMFG
jgi:hypothetical protein